MQKLFRRIFVLFCMVFASNAAMAQDVQFRFPSPSGSFLAGQFAFQGLNTGDAASALMEAADSQWDNPAVIERAFAALVADGRIDHAEPLARRMLELNPSSALAKLVVATVALKERRYASVVNGLEGVGLSDFVDVTATILRAWGRVGQSSLDTAFADLDDATNGALQEFLVLHKALMADMQNDAVTLELARQAYENEPFLGRIVEFYTRTLGNAGQGKEALSIMQEFEDQGINHPGVDFVKREILAGRLPGKFATSIPAGASELFLGIGVAMGRDGAPEVALLFLQLGLYLDPQADAILLTIGRFFENSQRFESANEYYARIAKNSIYKPDAIVRTAQNVDSLGDRPEAIRRLKNIIVVQPENLNAVAALGDLLRIDEQFDEAAEVYSKAIDLVDGNRPRDWIYFYRRAIAHEQRGAWEDSEADLLHALELNPTQPQVLNFLGYSWVDKGINLQRALGMIEQAVRTNPGDGYIVDSLGWAVYKLERFDEAVKILEEAVKLNPNDPEINDHLGDAYWRVGRKNEANFQWAIAAEMDDRGSVLDRVLPKLENGLPNIDGS